MDSSSRQPLTDTSSATVLADCGASPLFRGRVSNFKEPLGFCVRHFLRPELAVCGRAANDSAEPIGSRLFPPDRLP